MTPSLRSNIIAAAGVLLLLAVMVPVAAAADGGDELVPVPTCRSFGETWYFPNACPAACAELGSVFDTDRSRNVNENHKCFCEGMDRPYCTDDPACGDLGIYPGTVRQDCSRVCGGDNRVKAKTSVEFNGYQFHYVVSCSCSDGTRICENDSVLLSDMDYMASCTGGGDTSLGVAGAGPCGDYCDATGVFTQGGSYSLVDGENDHHRCACTSASIITDTPNITEAVVCDDAIARVNDGSGLGDPCYENVGVTQIDCPDPVDAAPTSAAAASGEQAPTTTKTLVSSAAIFTGVWLLPW